jgi:hypothetical protein
MPRYGFSELLRHLLRDGHSNESNEKDGAAMEKSNKHEASAQFAKLQRVNDAKKAASDYETAAIALRAKTERLKALRLERDAAAPPPPAASKRKSKAKGKSGTLSDWLDGQDKEGRHS